MRLFYSKEISVFSRIFDRYKNKRNDFCKISLTEQLIQVFVKIGYIEDFFKLNIKEIESDAEAGSILCDIVETGFEYTKIKPEAFGYDGEYGRLIFEMYNLIYNKECRIQCRNRDKDISFCNIKLEMKIIDVYNILEAFMQSNFNFSRNNRLYKRRMAEYKLFLEKVLAIIYYEKRNLKDGYEYFPQICSYER